jgi:replicative DNA helicase
MLLDEFSQAGKHVLDSEMAVLGCLLQSPRAVSEVLEVLTANCFYRPAHGLVFQAVADVVADKGADAVDHLTVRERLAQKGQLVEAGGQSYLFDLEQQAPAISNAMFYAGIVLEHAQRRQLRVVAKKIEDIAVSPDAMTPNEMVDMAADVVASIRVDAPEDGFTSIDPVLREVFADIDQAFEGIAIKPGYDAHIAALSRRVGGWSPGEVYVVGAATNMGKTAFGRGEAINLVRQTTTLPGGEVVNVPVLYVSAEVSEKQMARLLLSSYSGVAQKAIRGGRAMSEVEYKQVGDVAEEFLHLPLYFLCSGALTPARIAAKCEVINRKHGINPVVIVDYVQALVGTSNGGSKTYAIDEFMKRCKDHARDKDVAYIVLSQLAREASKPDNKGDVRRPSMFDLADSSGIEKWAAAIILIFREEYYLARKEGREEAIMSLAELITAKNRYGSIGVDSCAWVPRKVRFMEEAQ